MSRVIFSLYVPSRIEEDFDELYLQAPFKLEGLRNTLSNINHDQCPNIPKGSLFLQAKDIYGFFRYLKQ